MPNARPKLKSGQFGHGFPGRRDEGVLDAGGIRCDSVVYDTAVDGLATGDYTFRRSIPAGAVVTRIFSEEQTAFTSGGSATITIKAGSTALTGALAFDTDFTGAFDSQTLASSAEAIKVAADSLITVTVGGAALTAGKARIFIEYVLPTDE